jgi:carboxylate-amine ligase
VTAEEQVEHRFGSGTPFSLGVEEELFLVDPVTGAQANASTAVLERLGDLEGEVARELHACQVELITGVHASAGSAVRELCELRRAVVETGAGILAAGTHPSAEEGDAAITDKERYERIYFLLGDAAITPVAGLHVHVGMPDGETAIRVFNALRRDLPLLQALAANSPFRHGRDTGLASAREVTLRGWPRSGAPRAMRDYEDFVEMVQRLTQAADVPDYTWFWWKLRPHPRLGTVEIRSLDAQTRPADTAALVALVHCLARDAAESSESAQAGVAGDPPPQLVEEGLFRAARFGVHGRIPDAEGTLRPVSELLDDALGRAEPWAHELGCGDELDGLRDLVARGGGAGAQRAVYEIAGIDAVVRRLVELTQDGG